MFLSSSMMVTTFLLLLISLHVSGNIYGPRLLTSHVGESVTIKCYYLTTIANKHDRKFWCKESERFRTCHTLISTTDFIHESYKTRVSIKDIPQNGILLVTMTQLEKTDSGRYRCGIGKSNTGLYYGINMNIWEDLSKGPEIFWGKVSGSVAIKCSSEGHNSSERKFLCKVRRTGCFVMADSKRNTSRFVFTAEDSSGNFKVFINQLRKEDSGMYKCGTGMPDNDASARAMQLQITEESVFSNILHYAQATYESQTSSASFQSCVTPTNEFYKDSSLQTKPNLLSIVIPVFLVALVLAATIITVFVKIKQQKKCDPSGVDARNPEAAIELNEQKCPVEHAEEENRGSDEQGSSVEPNKKIPTVYCLLSKQKLEESRGED
ncbi:polymeric immunoglobulin receptor-like isoform X2 [Eublepharis macularius]|uniref:polymeric immunoglobulin receptor-like isoform X2 n=1 Tax=Eublepharis macularius TaxID=481883 RepID=UPI00240EFD32|nr:polymeric immunoglobulin receptor-like isoform X2 [Eublepharis macularius]